MLEVGVSVIKNQKIAKDTGFEYLINLMAIMIIKASKLTAMITDGSNKELETLK